MARLNDAPARSHVRWKAPQYRVPLGMPLRDDGRRAGAVVSVLLHALVVLLIVFPFIAGSVIQPIQQGAGGPGPAGGGGGGHGGTGGLRETLHFVRVAPEPAAPKPSVIAPVLKPVAPKVEPPKPKPVETPAVKVPEQATLPAASTTVASIVDGANGGSGRDGSAGAGPGSGGGVGSGVGTGRGSGTGPGTGGGSQVNYPPQPIEFFLPPMPPPSSVKGVHFIAEFDVDSTGRVLDFKFTETRDGDYNRRLASVLRSMRFRAGTRPDGTPVRMKAQVGYEF